MRSAALSKLKASLGKYITWVKSGEEVLVTERGKPVAKIIPIKEKSTRENLIEMEKQGLIKLGSGKISENFWKLSKPKDDESLALKILIEEREKSF